MATVTVTVYRDGQPVKGARVALGVGVLGGVYGPEYTGYAGVGTIEPVSLQPPRFGGKSCAPGMERPCGSAGTLLLAPARLLLSRTFTFGQCQASQSPDLSPLHQAKGDQTEREKRPDHAKDDYIDLVVGRRRHGCKPQQEVYTPLEDVIHHSEVLRGLGFLT